MQPNSLPPLTVPVIGRPTEPPLSPKTEINKAKEPPVSTASASHVQVSTRRPGWASKDAALPSPSKSKENDKASKNTLDFNLIQKFDYIQTAPGDTNNDGVRSTITYSRSKDEIGGTDLGILGKVDGKEFLIKTGLGRGLLSQIANHFLKGDMKNAEKKAGYIAGNYIRLVGEDPDQQKPLQKALFDSLEIFFSSVDGKKILDKAKEKKIGISDVNKIHGSLVAQNPSLRNVLGVPILMDVINGTAGQQLVNDYQRTYLDTDRESRQIPNAKLFLVGSNPLIGSQFLPDAVPFDNFLSKNFLPEGKTFKDIRNASELIKKAGRHEAVDAGELEAVNKFVLAMTTPKNLAAGKAHLIAQLKGLEGLFASILMRLTMGEKDDLGPDNMLVVKGKNGRNKIVNIDITGFRYNRENDSQLKPEDKPVFGWKDIIQNPDTSLDKLLDGSVFNRRYLGGIDAVQHAIVEALKEVVGDQASVETKNVRDWYASLDAEASKSALKDLAQNLLRNLDASVAPDAEQMDKAIARNCTFIDAAVKRSKEKQ